MASPAKVAANKRNARRSTGPRTSTGKAASSRNALRHGLRAATLVLPHAETVADWEGFRAGIVEALAPVGALELDLAERVAALSWRLRRVTRFEAATLGERQRVAEADAVRATCRRFPHLGRGGYVHDEDDEDEPNPYAGAFLEDLQAEAKDRDEVFELLRSMRSRPDEDRLEPGQAAGLVLALADHVDLDEWNEDGSPAVALPGVPPGLWEHFDGWTVGLVRAAAEALVAEAQRRQAGRRALTPAQRQEVQTELQRKYPDLFDDEDDEDNEPAGSLPSTGAELFDAAGLDAARSSGTAARRAREAGIALEHLRGERTIPAEPDLDRVLRYESHLQRQLSMTLGEFERVRRLRAGAGQRPTVRGLVELPALEDE